MQPRLAGGGGRSRGTRAKKQEAVAVVRVVNFAHPLTEAQRTQLQELLGQPVGEVLERMVQVDHQQPMEEQVRALVDSVGLTGAQWQTEPLVLVLPGLSVAAALVLAEVHGRRGHFPCVVRLRPVEGSTPTRYEVAEILNLQDARDRARQTR